VSIPCIDPGRLFDVSGKVAIVVGATGSFGQVVCSTLGSAGAKLVITAGNAADLAELDEALKSAGIEAVQVARRPNTEADCDAIVAAAVEHYGSIDILVVASGMNDVSPIEDMAPERFQKVMLANVDGAWLIA
jgi:NAD(P)-dependent dehydrogenase (short-subunit alcohol dehydrogenase family)